MLMRHVHPTLQFTHMLPYGAILHENGVQFVVYSRSATAMRLLLYDDVNDAEPEETIEFSPNKAVGLDGALAKIAHTSYGPFLLGIVAAGLIAFGVYSLSDARYRRI